MGTRNLTCVILDGEYKVAQYGVSTRLIRQRYSVSKEVNVKLYPVLRPKLIRSRSGSN